MVFTHDKPLGCIFMTKIIWVAELKNDGSDLNMNDGMKVYYRWNQEFILGDGIKVYYRWVNRDLL